MPMLSKCSTRLASPRRALTFTSCWTFFAKAPSPSRATSCYHISHSRPTVTHDSTRFIPRRHTSSFTHNARHLWRQYPFSVSLASAIICVGAGSLIYVNYIYQTYFIGAFTAYPEDVAKKLRRALYYTNTDLDPKNASKYFRQALHLAEEHGMDPLSDEILGIKIRVAELMEKIENYPKAIHVLEIIVRDCLDWEKRFGALEANRTKRTRVLKKAIAINVKLGELYSSSFVWDLQKAEEKLTWAVETILREKQRRLKMHVSDEDEGEWISDDELGASLETIADNYRRKDNHVLATQLYLSAINAKPTNDCHTVVLMNSLAASLGHQVPRQPSSATTPAQKEMLSNARNWADKALAVAADIAPPERTDECDQGCVAALYNLGDFAQVVNDTALARRNFEEAKALAKAIGYQDGVENCVGALKQLDVKR